MKKKCNKHRYVQLLFFECLPRELVSFDPLLDSSESSKELPWTVDDKSSIVEPRLLPAAPILEDVGTPVRLKQKKYQTIFLQAKLVYYNYSLLLVYSDFFFFIWFNDFCKVKKKKSYFEVNI